MKRIAARVVVFLLLGAIVNVAVAWGIALWTPLWFGVGSLVGRSDVDWLVTNTNDASLRDNELEYVTEIVGIGFDSNEIAVIGWRKDDGSFGFDTVAVVVRSGWPLKTAVGGRVTSRSLAPTNRNVDAVELNRSTPYPGINRYVPLRPIWPGFAINTIFYAAVLWMFWAAPFALRRRLRIRRGLCPACAYPIGTSPVCTECGAAVKKSVISGQKLENVQT